MSKEKSFYITTTLPYVNAEPHMGHAMEFIQADIIARWKKSQGYEVFFNTGTDEHGQKVFDAAQKQNKDPQVYTNELAEKFKDLKNLLGLSEDLHFIRTTEERHKKAAQEMWKRCEKYIYFRNYEIKYCVGCELEKTDSELVNGRCSIHQDKELEMREETNYFFRFSEFGPKLLKLYENKLKVTPDYRINEIKALIDRGLEDFSISRLKEKMPWGVPITNRDNNGKEHVMYVWFDALVSYISTLGWPDDIETFEKFWVRGTPTQFAGKDQVRQQAAMWQAMLFAADIPRTKNIVVHGFLNFAGEKMSKSLGNVIRPQDIINEFGIDGFRYFIARDFNQFEDTDVSMERLKESYNANLANGLGNLVSRIMKMASDNLEESVKVPELQTWPEYSDFLNNFEINKATDLVWREISALDLVIQTELPFKLIKTDITKGRKIISDLVVSLHTIAKMLSVILPETSEKILEAIKNNKLEAPLFPRKD